VPGEQHAIRSRIAEGREPRIGRRRAHSHHLAAELAGEPARLAQCFSRDRPQLAVALLDEHQDLRSFSSSLRMRTSSATASGPSPTIRPAARSGGKASETTSRLGSPRSAACSSIGFFLAAMMPLSEA
jgi:hypothetical protein